MLYVLKTSWALLLGMLLLLVGNGLQGTLLGIRGAIEGYDAAKPWLIGIFLLCRRQCVAHLGHRV